MDYNSIEYAWKDIEVVFLGRVIGRITEIEYTTEVEKKHIYGRGKKPLGIQTGNEKVTGQITIGQSELEAMIRKAQSLKPGAKPTDMSFDVNISYIMDVDVVRDRVVGFTVTQMPKSMKQGDTEMDVKLPGIAMDVLYNI